MARVEFDRSVLVAADRATVWQVVTDVEILARWVRIVHDVVESERLRYYTAVLADQVGPFKLKADLKIDVTVPEEGAHIAISAAGRDRAMDSKLGIEARVTLADAEAGGTTLKVEGSYQVTGRAAAMGSGVIRKKADTILADFFGNAEEELNA
jgi:carbon monoxide dehydrogenase subunit G